MPLETPSFRPAFAHRAWAAFRALSRRCSGVSLAALAWPPLLAPRRPSLTAEGFFLRATPRVYACPATESRHFSLDNARPGTHTRAMENRKPLNRGNGSGVASHPITRRPQDALGSRLHCTAFGSREEGRHEDHRTRAKGGDHSRPLQRDEPSGRVADLRHPPDRDSESPGPRGGELRADNGRVHAGCRLP